MSTIVTLSCANDSNVVALGVLVGVLLILLIVSIIINGWLMTRYISNVQLYNLLFSCSIKVMTAKHTSYSIILNYYVLKHIYRAADDNIAMQVCEPYDLHNTKINEVKEGVYEECKTSSDADRVYE